MRDLTKCVKAVKMSLGVIQLSMIPILSNRLYSIENQSGIHSLL